MMKLEEPIIEKTQKQKNAQAKRKSKRERELHGKEDATFKQESEFENNLMVIEMRDNKGCFVHVDHDGWVRVEKVEYPTVFTYKAGIISCADGRQLYVTENSWLGADFAGHSTNTNKKRRVFCFRDGVFTIKGGRQLYMKDMLRWSKPNHDFYLGAGKEGIDSNKNASRRTFN